MGRYVCTNCNYRFESSKLSECPYCGVNKVEKEKTAEELLEEIDDLLNN